MEELLILVDKDDNELGAMDKLSVHQRGLLHRAFSIFIFNTRGELLLQQRAESKYHSGSLWTNTCCSHPRSGEELTTAISRRLEEEMGMHCSLTFAFSFTYKMKFDNGLTEHEFDHVFFGHSDELPLLNLSEVQDYKYISLTDLSSDLNLNPDKYSSWLKICLPKVKDHFNQIQN